MCPEAFRGGLGGGWLFLIIIPQCLYLLMSLRVYRETFREENQSVVRTPAREVVALKNVSGPRGSDVTRVGSCVCSAGQQQPGLGTRRDNQGGQQPGCVRMTCPFCWPTLVFIATDWG